MSGGRRTFFSAAKHFLARCHQAPRRLYPSSSSSAVQASRDRAETLEICQTRQLSGIANRGLCIFCELGIEAFAISVLRRRPWLDVSRLCANSLDPVLHGLSNEFRAVSGTNERWQAAQNEQVGQCIQHVRGVELAIDAATQRKNVATTRRKKAPFGQGTVRR